MTPEYQNASPYPPDNVLKEIPTIELPLRRIASVPGDAGFGLSAPQGVPTKWGVIVTRKGCISLYTKNLSVELWRVEVDDWSNSVLITKDTIFHGPATDRVREISPTDGKVINSFPVAEAARIVGIEDDLCILVHGRDMLAVDWSGKERWRVQIAPGGILAHASSKIYAPAALNRSLMCIHTTDGEILWTTSLPPEGKGDAALLSSKIGSGSSSVAVIKNKVIVVPQDRQRVFALSADSGEIVAVGRLPFRGNYIITQDAMVLHQPFGLLFLDHETMTELAEEQFREYTEPLYKGQPLVSYAFCLTEKSVIWTTPYSAFMAVTRNENRGEKRTTWLEEIPGSLMPIAKPPTVYDDYMYYTNMGKPLELLCYQSNKSRK